MSKFKLNEATVTVRGVEIRVRELTQGERSTFLKRSKDDPHSLGQWLMATAAIDPKWTEAEAAEEPGEVADAVAGKVLELCGYKDDEPKKD